MMLSDNFQNIFIPFVFSCFFITIACLLKFSTSRKAVGLPRPSENNIILYFRWILSVLRSGNLRKNAILHVASSIPAYYKKKGVIHLHIPFFDLVILFQPNTVQALLQNRSNIDKPIFYHFFKEWLGSSIVFSKGDQWHKKRKLLSPAFHLRILENFIPIFEKHSQLLVEKITFSSENGPLDIVPLTGHCVMNILCEAAMGLHNGRSKFDFSVLGEHITILLNIIEERIYGIWRWPDIIFRLTQNGRKFQRSLEVINKITDQIIEERISLVTDEERKIFSEDQQVRQPLPFLDILLSSIYKNSGLTLEDVRQEVKLFLFAGHDTSTLTLIWALHLLGKHPDVQKRLQGEVDQVLGDDKDRLLSKSDLYNLKYMECVIKETLRIYPVVPFIGRKITEEITIGNYKIPKGFTCIMSILDIHQNPDIFPCPDRFDPERFLPEKSVGRHPYAFIPFSAGPRNCIGQKFSMMEMKVVLARLMQKFTFETLQQNVEMGYRITLYPNEPVWLQVKKR